MTRWLWLSALVCALDQGTKWLAEDLLTYHHPVRVLSFFDLTLAYNRGAAWSFLGDQGGWQRWLFVGLAGVVSLMLAVWLTRLDRRDRMMAVSMALILGGALGNLVDRLIRGYVIDFLDFHHLGLAGWPGFDAAGHWPAFNVADSAITLGAVLLLVDAMGWRRGRG